MNNKLDFKEEQFNEIVEDLRALLFGVKQQEYNNGDIKVYDYFLYKPESFDTMIYIKSLREIQKKDQFELDSLYDLIAYSMFKLHYYKTIRQTTLSKERSPMQGKPHEQ